jgi:hypothetical protein
MFMLFCSQWFNTNRLRKGFVSATAMIIMFAGFSFPASATGNTWYDKYVALESSIGGDYYTSPESGNLAWSESYILRSYLSMYQLTKDTAWLNKFTTHTDTVIANANDNDGDGYLGWDTYTYSPLSADNSGFETPSSSDSTLPDQWTRFQSTSTTAYRSNAAGTYNNDSWGLVLKTNGTTWQKLYQPLTSYEPNTHYVLRVYGKTNGSAAKGTAYIHDRTTDTILGSITIDGTAWDYYSVEFVTPAAGHNLQLWLGHESYTVSNGIAYFDNVRVSGRFPYTVHDGMTTLPIAEFVRLVNGNSALSSYQTKATSYRSFIENEIVPRWESSSYLGNSWKNITATTGIYTQPPNLLDTLGFGGPGTNLPYNMSIAFTHMLKVMYDVNGNAAYLSKANKMAQYLKNNLTANGTAYTWNYSDSGTTPEDTSHGHVDMAFIAEMYRSGLIFTGSDMEKFTDTLTVKMWNQSLTAPTLARYVSGLSPTQTQYSKIMMNWLELAQFDPVVWYIAAEQFRSYTPVNTGDLLTLTHIMKWDPKKVVNQGFELVSSTDSTLPARWARVGSTSSTAYRDSANKYDGSYGATIVGNGTSWQYLTQAWEDWTPSTSYTLTFYGKTDGSAAGGRIIVKNETTGLSLLNTTFSDTAWTAKTFTFTSPSIASHIVKIYLGHTTYTVTNGKVFFDEVKIRPTSDSW